MILLLLVPIPPPVAETRIIPDLGKFGIRVAELLTDTLYEGAHIGAEADFPFSCDEALAVNDVVNFPIAHIAGAVLSHIGDNIEFGQCEVQRHIFPHRATRLITQSQRVARMGFLASRMRRRFFAPEDEFYAPTKDREAPGLFNNIHSPAQETGLFIDLVAQHSKKYDRNIDLLGAQPLHHLNSRYSRHLPI